MNSLLANSQLELACRVGSLEGIGEALEEGADINCNGSSPLFLAIGAGDRAAIEKLVELGVDVSLFQVDAGLPDVVDHLMGMVPKKADDGASASGLDAKALRAFDRMIRNKGLGEPIQKKRRSEYENFAEGLKCVGAEECHSVVKEFLEQTAGLTEEEIKVGDYSEISARYLRVSDEDEPKELLKEYLKESKKQQKG